MQVKVIMLVNINGKDVDLKDLPKEMKEKQVEEMNRRALEAIGYQRVKTA